MVVANVVAFLVSGTSGCGKAREVLRKFAGLQSAFSMLFIKTITLIDGLQDDVDQGINRLRRACDIDLALYYMIYIIFCLYLTSLHRRPSECERIHCLAD